jgi:hypothetical protein
LAQGVGPTLLDIMEINQWLEPLVEIGLFSCPKYHFAILG